jgi:hypothetical protein
VEAPHGLDTREWPVGRLRLYRSTET